MNKIIIKSLMFLLNTTERHILLLNGQEYMELNIIVFMQDGKRIKTQNICLEDIGDVIMNRADEISSMTDEELADFIINFENRFGEEYEGEQSCLSWLQKESEEQ